MSDFDRQDQRYLEAAQGWLGLGNWLEANEELERITPRMRAHPDVLTVRCKIYCDAKKWDYVAEVANTLCQMLPESAFGPLHLAMPFVNSNGQRKHGTPFCRLQTSFQRSGASRFN